MTKPEYHLTIKEYPIDERPRERLIKFGAEALTNAELLAIIIRTGNQNETAISLARRILAENDKGLRLLAENSVNDLSKIKGIGNAKAAQIKAAIEIGKRLVSTFNDKKIVIKSPEDVKNLVMENMRYLDKEHFCIIKLDTKNKVLDFKKISIGTLNSSVVHPREVFKSAIQSSSAAVILVHNHPSGDPTPSSQDIEITKRLIESGKILGIDVLDHVIIGDGCYTSLKEKNIV